MGTTLYARNAKGNTKKTDIKASMRKGKPIAQQHRKDLKMNYYEPREKTDKEGKPTGLYHYTRMNVGRVWPTGYCAQDCPGHETKEGAYEHQRQYLLDNAKFDSGKFKDALFRCDVPDCPNFSDTSTHIKGRVGSYTLCEEHRNREGLEKVLKVGDVISSW